VASRSRRSIALAALAVLATGAGVGCGQDGHRSDTATPTSAARHGSPSVRSRPYRSSSPFNTPLPANPKLIANSDAIVRRFLAFNQIKPLWIGTADTDDDYGRPVYYAAPGDPVYRLRCKGRYCPMRIEGARIRLPRGARPAAGGDGHMAIIQPNGTEYDLYEVSTPIPKAGGVVVSNGGGRTRVNGSGIRVPNGATAAKFGLLAGVIRAREMQAGVINHALVFGTRCVADTYVYPAAGRARTCTSMGDSGLNAPPTGARFQLAMSAGEIDALAVPAWKKAILRALATHGMYLGDTGGGFLGLESETMYSSLRVRNPWPAIARALRPQGGISTWISSRDGHRDYTFDIASGVPWERLRVIDPCVTRLTC
jgi:hypothetical protein